MSFPNPSHSQFDGVFRDVANGIFVDPNLLHHAMMIQKQTNRPDLLQRNEANRIAAANFYYQQQQQQQHHQQQARIQAASTAYQQQVVVAHGHRSHEQHDPTISNNNTRTPAQDLQVKQQQWQQAGRYAYSQAQQKKPQPQPPSRQVSSSLASQSDSVQAKKAPAQGHGNPISPKSQQRIITDQDWLERETAQLQQMTTKWLKEAKLPASNNRQAKIEWLRLLGQVAAKDETKLKVSLSKHAAMAAAWALYESAPDKITLELYCPLSNLEHLRNVDNEFVRGQANEQGDNTDPSTPVFLGSILCRKTDDFLSKIHALVETLGLEINNANLHGIDIPHYFGCNPKIGENFYFQDNEGKAVIQITGLFTPRTAWRNQLDAMKKQTEVKDKVFTLIEKPQLATKTKHVANATASTTIPAFAPETYLCLWLPADFPRVMQNVRDHLHFGASESIEIQRLLQKCDPQAASLKLEIVKQEFQAIKKMRRMPSKLVTTFALTMALADDPRWMCAVENVAAVFKVMDQLSQYWRSKLLAKKDEVLGLGIPGEGCDETTGLSCSRTALYTVLELLAKRFEPLLGGRLQLNWQPKPNPPKKKRSKIAAPVKANNADSLGTTTLSSEQPNKKQKLSLVPNTKDVEEKKVTPTSVLDSAIFFPDTATNKPSSEPTNQVHGSPSCQDI